MVLEAEGCGTDKSRTATWCRPSRHHEDPLSAHSAGPGCILSLRPSRYVSSWFISLGNHHPEGLGICFGMAEGKGQTTRETAGREQNCALFSSQMQSPATLSLTKVLAGSLAKPKPCSSPCPLSPRVPQPSAWVSPLSLPNPELPDSVPLPHSLHVQAGGQ